MLNLIIAAITGPTGVGKSTVSQELSKRLPRAVNIDVDSLKHFIVSDFRYEDGEKGLDQWHLLGKNIGMLASNFHNEGYNVIINGYLRQTSWQEIANHVYLSHKILLMPDVATVYERDERRDETTKMGSEAVKDHYNFFSTDNYAGFERVDSTNQTVDETASKVFDMLISPRDS